MDGWLEQIGSIRPMQSYEPKDISTPLWNLETGQSVYQLQEDVAGEFSPDGSRLLTFRRRLNNPTSFDAAIRDVATRRELVKVTLRFLGRGFRDNRVFVALDCIHPGITCLRRVCVIGLASITFCPKCFLRSLTTRRRKLQPAVQLN